MMFFIHSLAPLAVILSLTLSTSPGYAHPTVDSPESNVILSTQHLALHDADNNHNDAKPLPLIIWHGLGDKFDNPGLQSVSKLVQSVHPGTHVHLIQLGETGDDDRTATFFGNLTTQIEQVCEDLLQDPLLHDPSSPSTLHVNALGFSQGGQFLRGLLQRCAPLHVHNLVTFGSQHNGIAQFQRCGPWDYVCKASSALLQGNAWTAYVQGRVVPAQYYRTTNATTGEASEEYLANSAFLADVNNERAVKNAVYARRVAALRRFVMVLFSEDTTVIPKESGWFAEVDLADPEKPVVTPLRERRLYQEDWLGLKALDEKDGLVFRTVPGKHMEFRGTGLEDTIREFFGPEVEDAHGGYRAAVQGLVEQENGYGL